ncbi:MAG TPA: hypothetical protein VG944_01900 [Fimbriimonas sp.]|nr:hypothetical protein [Fimbriimonas sp.]
MKTLFCLAVSVVVTGPLMGVAQDRPVQSAASRAYHEYRLVTTDPPYGLKKVHSLIAHIKDNGSDNKVISAKTFSALSTKEKFTYCMEHAENFAQNCDPMPPILGEESKIFSHVPDSFEGDYEWSDRQEDFMKSHRGTVVGLLRKMIHTNRRVGLNVKQAIILLDAYDLIPDLAAAYRRTPRDKDILTVYCCLMRDGKFKPFMKSITYHKLYGDESTSYKSFIAANAANAKLTTDRAMAYYRSRKG